MRDSADVVCVGGGAIGLLIAHDLAERGLRVTLIDRGPLGREASWAGAGIIPPASVDHAQTPYEKLRAVSYDRFPKLAAEFQSSTGADIGYRITGGLEVARHPQELDQLTSARRHRTRLGVHSEWLEEAALRVREPHLSASGAEWIPAMGQVRNPRLLTALAARIKQMGVKVVEHTPIDRADRIGQKIVALHSSTGHVFTADHFVLAAGAWSAELLRALQGPILPIHPVQGQIIVFAAIPNEIRHIVLEGKRYLVPREDGLVLVGATEEEVGFEKQITDDALAELRTFAVGLFPMLADRTVVYSWAGLRPGNSLGHPLLGPIAEFENFWMATGHFRHGLQQSPGTARLLADWITGVKSFAEPADFSLTASPHDFSSPFQS